jgi:signal peptide peptidase SppA
MNKLALATLLQQPFCISEEFKNAMLPVVGSILLGNADHVSDYSAERSANTPRFLCDDGSSVTSWNTDDATEGSVMVLNLKGTMLKDSQMFGPIGTVEIASLLNDAEDNDNIIGCVLLTESGGGAYYSVKPLADAITSFRDDKPIIAVADDMMGSAAYYVATFCNEIFAINPRSIIGSIGVMCSFQDVQPALEKMGVVFHEIYATKSTQKNKDFNDALKGDYTNLIEELDALNEDFINDVKANRAGVISTSDNLIYSGATYFASVAKELGMIDNLGSLDDSIDRVIELANSPEYLNKPNDDIMENITALAGKIAPDQNAIDLANADLTLAGITAVTLVQESFITEASAVTQQNVDLTAKVAQLSTEKTNAETALQTAQAELAAANAKVEAFGKNAGAIHQATTAEKEDQPNASSNDLQAAIDAMPHNKKADNFK